mgnify:CR=1 FL=1
MQRQKTATSRLAVIKHKSICTGEHPEEVIIILQDRNNPNNSYGDIINHPHHVSTRHPRMAMTDRAAQFSPFAALTGYGGVIKETARLTDRKLELSESEKEDAKKDMASMLDYIDKLGELDTTGVEPMSHVFPVNNVMREDVVKQGYTCQCTRG